jgi:hypothetical protein
VNQKTTRWVMASIFLDWGEAQKGDLPMVCATCGQRATSMVERRLSTVGPGFLVIIRTRATVLLPYCPQHIVASWNGWVRVRALSINQEGIKLGQVSSDFVNAVHEYRRDPRGFSRDRRNEGDRDHEERQPRDHEESARGGFGGLTLTVTILLIVFAAVVVMCGVGVLMFTLLRPGGGGPAGPAGGNPQNPLGPPAVPRGPPYRR